MNASESHRFFVTGAAGFVGRHLSSALAAGGHHVRAMTRRPMTTEHGNIEPVIGDLHSDGPWMDALADTDVVIHCAGNARFGNGTGYQRDNVDTSARLLDAVRARAKRLTRFVFVSTTGVVDRAGADRCETPINETTPLFPTSDYGRSKAVCEALVTASRLPFTIVRPAMVVGSDMRADSHFAVFARWALTGHPLARIAWPGALSVVHVDDLVRALILVSTHPDALNRTFMCAGDPVAIAEVFDDARPAARVPVAPMLPVIRRLAPALPFSVKSLVLPALVANDHALRALGWSPAHRGRDALTDVIARETARATPRMPPPAGQTVITGAASGLGRAMAESLAPTGRRLLLVDRDGPALSALAARWPAARAVTVDLADEAAWDPFLASADWTSAPVTELFACAGFGRRGPFAASSIDGELDMIRVNVMSRLRLAHAAIADMTPLQFGRIVFISSSSAFQPLPMMSTYAASNAALLAAGEGLSYEVAADGIHVMTVCPGGMRTNFQQSAGVKEDDRERLMAPEDVAAGILRGLERRQTTLIVSTRSFAMSLLARVLPRTLSLRLWGRLMATLR